MAMKIPTRRLSIRYSGVYDFDGLYKLMIEWFKSRRFWFHETTYKHKPGNEFGREEEIKWNATRKMTDFYMWDVDIYFHVWDMNVVEVIGKDGKKKKLTQARMEMHFLGTLTIDYRNRWEKNKFTETLLNFYIKYILHPEGIMSSLWWDELYYRIYKLSDLVKDYLDMSAKGYEYRRYMKDNIP